MRRGRAAFVAAAACWATAVALAWAAGEVLVTPLVTDGRVMASFTALATFDDDARELVKSGLPVTFDYTVELRRPAVWWFDGTLAAVQVSASAKYDTLSDTYQVSKAHADTIVWSESTRDQEQVRAWMTAFEKILLEPDEALEPNRDYYVQVRLHQRPKRRVSLWPWGGDDGSGRADFTYLR
jgi:hypothetical protein